MPTTTPLHAIDEQPGLKATDLCTPRYVLGGLALAAVGIGVVSDAWYDMLGIALRDEESSQVLLVPFVVGWLVWIRRGRLATCRRQATWIGPLLVGIGWLVSTIGYHHAIQSFWHGGAVLVAVGCFLTVTGGDVLRRFLPAFIVLMFLVPVP
ncbi:MAG: archaeosortase/exosortase family protein, partial [Pirellulales bacterium]